MMRVKEVLCGPYIPSCESKESVLCLPIVVACNIVAPLEVMTSLHRLQVRAPPGLAFRHGLESTAPYLVGRRGFAMPFRTVVTQVAQS